MTKTDQTNEALTSLLTNVRLLSAAAIGLEENALSKFVVFNPDKALQAIHVLTTTALEIVQGDPRDDSMEAKA